VPKLKPTCQRKTKNTWSQTDSAKNCGEKGFMEKMSFEPGVEERRMP